MLEFINIYFRKPISYITINIFITNHLKITEKLNKGKILLVKNLTIG